MNNDGLVVDANIIKIYIGQKKKESGPICSLVDLVIECSGLAINDKVEQEWRNTAGEQFFCIWFDEHLVNHKIR
jgi:hypothetical protein